MAVQIIQGLTDVAFLEEAGISFDKSTSARGSATFSVLESKFSPIAGQRISIYLNGSLRWGGEIHVITRKRVGNKDRYDTICTCECVSWEIRLERQIADPKVYSGMTAGDIVNYLITTYTDNMGIHVGTVVTGASAADLGDLFFSGMTIAAIMDELGSRSNCSWYVDEDLLLHFIDIGTTTVGAIVLSTANQNIIAPSITETSEDYCNSVAIQVSWDGIPPTPHTFVGNGTAMSFTLPAISGIPQIIDHVSAIKLNGIEQSFGIFGVDSNTSIPPTGSKSYYYEIGQNIIYQDGGLPALQASDQLQVDYWIIGRNIITYQDDPEVTARALIEDGNGVHQHFIDDSGNIDQVGALQKAIEYINRRAPGLNGAAAGTLPTSYTLSLHSYATNANNVKPGAVIKVNITNSPTTGGLQNLLVQSVTAKYMPDFDPSGVRGYFDYTFQAIKYVEVQDGVEFFKQFLDHNPTTTLAGAGGVVNGSRSGGGTGTGSGRMEQEHLFGARNGSNTAFTTTWVP
jgi:hypothetical protein